MIFSNKYTLVLRPNMPKHVVLWCFLMFFGYTMLYHRNWFEGDCDLIQYGTCLLSQHVKQGPGAGSFV